MDRNTFIDSIMDKLDKKIKIGNLSVQTEKKLDGLVTIRYQCKYVWPEIMYGRTFTAFDMATIPDTKIDDLVDHIISEIADLLIQNSWYPSDFLEV